MEQQKIDKIYRLSSCDNIFVKSAVIFLPTLIHKKQAIIFVHHLENIDSFMTAANAEYPELKSEKYYHELSLEDRDEMREEFERKDFQFLYATPNMYEANGFFEDFVYDQIEDGNVLIAV